MSWQPAHVHDKVTHVKRPPDPAPHSYATDLGQAPQLLTTLAVPASSTLRVSPIVQQLARQVMRAAMHPVDKEAEALGGSVRCLRWEGLGTLVGDEA